MASSAQPRRERPIQFGKYTLLARIGGGGMGELFLAQLRSAGGFEKLVVIKRILSHLTDKPEFVDMFVAEARTAARISHPNVCQVYELGQVDGRYYMALEYLEGLPLADVMVARKRAPRMADLRLIGSLVTQTAEGLHHAHSLRDPDGESAHVVHLDINPRNVFVTSAGVAKVLDFGIVKVRGAVGQVQTGSVKGTYSYMAPEQLEGGLVEATADIFALGTITWEAVVGRRLFKRSSDLLTWRAIVEEPIPRPTKFRPDLPPDLDEAIVRALARPASERFQTAREFAAAVEQAIRPLGGPLTTLAVASEMEIAFATELGAQRERVFSAHRRQEADRVGGDAAESGHAARAPAPDAGTDAGWGLIESIDSVDPTDAPDEPRSEPGEPDSIELGRATDSVDESIPTLDKLAPVGAAGRAGGKGGAARKGARKAEPGVIDDWGGGGNDTRVAEPAYADLVSRMGQPSQQMAVPAAPLPDEGSDGMRVVEGPVLESGPDLDDSVTDSEIEPDTKPVPPEALAAARMQGLARAVVLPSPPRRPRPASPPAFAAAPAVEEAATTLRSTVVVDESVDEPVPILRPPRRWMAAVALVVSAATGAAIVLLLNGRGAERSAGHGKVAEPGAAPAGAAAPGNGVVEAPIAPVIPAARAETAAAPGSAGSAEPGTPPPLASGESPGEQAVSTSGAPAASGAKTGAATPTEDDDPVEERARARRDKMREEREERDQRGRKAEKATRARAARQRERQREATPTRAAAAAERGFLTINAEPYATVFIDGKKRGTTPLVRLGLPAGQHRLRLVSSKGQPDKKIRVKILAGQELRKSIRW